jgi:RHS repeat-associated protein
MLGRDFSGKKYRFGFNGQELDDEINGSGNTYSALFWEYDSRLGRRWNVDPLSNSFPWQSSYAAFNNNPINKIDPTGEAAIDPPTKDEVKKGEGPSSIAKRNNISLDQLAQNNPDIFKNYDQYENKNDYWENADKNYIIHPGQMLNTSNQTSSPENSNNGVMSTVSNLTFIIGAAGTMAENTPGSIRLFRTQGRFNPKYYPKMGGTSQRPVGFGIKTHNISKFGKGLGWVGIGVTTVFDIYGMSQHNLHGPKHPDAVHPGKAGLNLSMGLYGMWFNPPAAITYFAVDTYCGGWPTALKKMDDLQKENQKILGTQFRIIPSNKFE